MELDQETRDKIIETHTDIKHICDDLEQGREQFKRLDSRISKQDTRLRRVENLFLPVLAAISIFAHKVTEWLRL